MARAGEQILGASYGRDPALLYFAYLPRLRTTALRCSTAQRATLHCAWRAAHHFLLPYTFWEVTHLHTAYLHINPLPTIFPLSWTAGAGRGYTQTCRRMRAFTFLFCPAFIPLPATAALLACPLCPLPLCPPFPATIPSHYEALVKPLRQDEGRNDLYLHLPAFFQCQSLSSYHHKWINLGWNMPHGMQGLNTVFLLTPFNPTHTPHLGGRLDGRGGGGGEHL